MKKRTLYTVVFVVSIVGLSVVQYQYLRIGLNLAKVQTYSKIESVADNLKEKLSTRNELSFLIASSLKQDTSFFTVPADSLSNTSSHFLNDYIRDQLASRGFEPAYSYTLYSKDGAYRLASRNPLVNADPTESFPIQVEGYLTETLGKPLILELQFNNLYGYYLSQLNGLVVPGLLFLLGICATVIWVLRTYYWQSRLITTTNEFINNLTHELKTPVFSISLAAKLLEERADDKQKVFLVLINQQVKRLSGHIDTVLELGSLESGKQVLKLEKIDFKPGLQALCEEFQTLIALEDGHFTFDLQGAEYPLKAAVFHLENAINNILDNSRKYSDKPEIKLHASIRKGKLYIVISDKGKGVSSENKHRIFQKYYRVTEGDLHQVKGYGLGLSYVKKIMEKHRGTVQIASEERKGTTLTLMLPLEN